MPHTPIDPDDARTPPGPHTDDLDDDGPRTAWRDVLVERERAADRYRALKQRLLEER